MATIDTYTIVSGKPQIDKDPQATLDYPFDWSRWLAIVGDSIASVVWTLDAGIAKTAESFTSQTATVWISGGTVGLKYKVVCRITTTAGRIDERTIVLKVVER
jgi:hypothetical protein